MGQEAELGAVSGCMYNYVVSAQKPTSVTHSVVGNFTSADDLNLVVGCTQITAPLPSFELLPLRIAADAFAGNCAGCCVRGMPERPLSDAACTAMCRKSTRIEIHTLTPEGLQVCTAL